MVKDNETITPAIDFDGEIRPKFISCGKMKDFRRGGNLAIKWMVDGSSILDNHQVTTYLFRIIGNVNQRLEPSSWDVMVADKPVKWICLAIKTSSKSDDGHYYFEYDDTLDDVDTQTITEIKRCKRAIYYKVCTHIDKMSAGALPLFIYVSDNQVIARATKNIVFNNKFYKDRQIVWTQRITKTVGGSPTDVPLCRVFVDTSTVDFFNYDPSDSNSKPTTKPPIVWITGDEGFVGCLNYYTGKILWTYFPAQGTRGSVFAGGVDPLNSVFWWVTCDNKAKSYLMYAHFDGLTNSGLGNINPHQVWDFDTSRDWDNGREEYQTPAMICSVNGNSTIINLIFATEEVWRIQVTNNFNGTFQIARTITDRKRFGAIDGVVKGQPNVLGITVATPSMTSNGLSDTVWTNGHVPQRHIQYTNCRVKVEKKETLKLAGTACYNQYSGLGADNLRKCVRRGGYDNVERWDGWGTDVNTIRDRFNRLQTMLHTVDDTISNYATYDAIYGDIANELVALYQRPDEWQDVDVGIAYKDFSFGQWSKAWGVLQVAGNPPLSPKASDRKWADRRSKIYRDPDKNQWECAVGNGVLKGWAGDIWDGTMSSSNTRAKWREHNIHRYFRTKIYRVLKKVVDVQGTLENMKGKLLELKSILDVGGYNNTDAGVGLNRLRSKIDEVCKSTTLEDCRAGVSELMHMAKSGTIIEFNRSSLIQIETLHQKHSSQNTATYLYDKVTTCILQDVGMVYGVGATNANAGTGPDERSSGSYRSNIRGSSVPTGEDQFNYYPIDDPATITLSGPLLTARINPANGRTGNYYQIFTNPMSSDQRWGWFGITLMADYITCIDDVNGLTANSSPATMKNHPEAFTWGDTAESDRFVPRCLYDSTNQKPLLHTDGKNKKSNGGYATPTAQPDVTQYPRVSQYGLAASIISQGWLRYVDGTQHEYFVYQADSVERSIHKLRHKTTNAKFAAFSNLLAGDTPYTLPITTDGMGDDVSTNDCGSRHVILDDSNTLWSISTNWVDRYYPNVGDNEFLPTARKYSHHNEYKLNIIGVDEDKAKAIKLSLSTYEVTTETSAFSGLLGRHFGNLPAIEYALLLDNVSSISIDKKDAINVWLEGIAQDKTWKNVFDLTGVPDKHYVGDSGDTYYMANQGYTVDDNGAVVPDDMTKSARCRLPDSTLRKKFIDQNEYNDDNLGIAPIKARGAMEAIDIGRPDLGQPVGHIKVIVSKEVDKTKDCDNAKFGLPATVPPVFGNLGTAPMPYSGESYSYNNRPVISSDRGDGTDYDVDNGQTYVIPSVNTSDPYNIWTYHLSAHGYDDLEVTERMVFTNLDGWGIRSFTFLTSGNAVGEPDPRITVGINEIADNSGAEGIWFFKNVGGKLTKATTGTVDESGIDCYKESDEVWVVNDENVWCQVIKKTRPDILWVEPNVRGGLIELGQAAQPNYDPVKRGMNGYKIIKGRIDLDMSPVYDLYELNDGSSVAADETNYFYVYERYPYPEFCFKNYGNEDVVINGFWGKCE